MRHCLTCWTDRGEKVPALPGEALCADCRDSQEERAHEALVASFYGASTPDPMERAWQQKAEWRGR